jgi:hypothetical protein
VLLRTSGRAAAADSKSVAVVPFDVPAGTRALTLRFDFAPRTSEDPAVNGPLLEAAFELHTRRRRASAPPEEVARWREALAVDARAKLLHNLMNVVLIDPSRRWRGRWDRNPAGTGSLILSRDHASRGFLAGAIEPGRWTAAVECHGVFGEPVSWQLEVEARGEPTAEEIAQLATPQGEPRPRRTGPGWYFGEMHSHSVHSDGKHEIADLCARVAQTGADFLCLTDHNTMSGHVAPPEVAVTLVPGCELTTFHGHHPLYGIPEAPPWHEDGRVLPLSEIAPRVRAHGGLVGVAHPFVPGDPICTGCRMPDHLDPADFDLMEVWYRRWSGAGSDNVAAYELWNRFWRQGRRILGVSARDWHGPEQDGPFPGDLPLTGVYAEDNTAAAIVEGLRQGRVIMSGGPIVDVERDGRGLRAHLSRLDGGGELRFLRDGDVVHVRAVQRDGDVVLPGPIAKGAWRAEVWQGASPRVLGNHLLVV